MLWGACERYVLHLVYYVNIRSPLSGRTGCGKTLAFVLPVVERIRSKNFIKQSRKKA